MYIYTYKYNIYKCISNDFLPNGIWFVEWPHSRIKPSHWPGRVWLDWNGQIYVYTYTSISTHNNACEYLHIHINVQYCDFNTKKLKDIYIYTCFELQHIHIYVCCLYPRHHPYTPANRTSRFLFFFSVAVVDSVRPWSNSTSCTLMIQ